jgi:hypothetical protein
LRLVAQSLGDAAATFTLVQAEVKRAHAGAKLDTAR